MNEIVNMIAKEKMVETIIKNITKDSSNEDYNDLVNDIYITLLEKDEQFLKDLYDREQIKYFITRIIMNNIKSTTSPFYYLYGRWNKKRTDLDNAKGMSYREQWDKD